MLYARYQENLQNKNFHYDPAQEAAVHHLQRLYDQLTNEVAMASEIGGLLSRILGNGASLQPTRGLYLWGGVGRGKTYLVDTFFDLLPLRSKKRTHFHRFMYKIHGELRTLRQQQDPLKLVAQSFADKARVICLDEFFVSDIADAMLLGGLLRALFDNGVTLVTTSNTAPDDLYKDGLQRVRFSPAIELIKERMQIFHLDGDVDYRLRYLQRTNIYYWPLDDKAEHTLEETFTHVSPEPGKSDVSLEIEGRLIPTRRHASGVVWFDFTDICDGPRSQNDYIEIARCFHTVLISNVPTMDVMMENQARRFLSLVDTFYDRNVKLILSAAAPVTEIYQGKKLQFEYQRVFSRLQEMESHDYLARAHLP
ncbi:MAG: cell division protein ZapE [Acidiferrobacterales bacterium]